MYTKLLLVTQDELEKSAKCCVEQYSQGVIDNDIKTYNKTLLEQASELLQAEFKDTQVLSVPGFSFKFAGQLTHTAGHVSPGKKTLEGQIVEIDINGKLEKFNGISTKDLINLEYWDQRIFLLVHVIFLLDLYTQIKSSSVSRFNPNEKILLEDAIRKEIIIAVNAFRIRNHYVYVAQQVNKNALIENFVANLLSQAADYFKPLQDGDELVIPIGYVTHAVYLTMIKHGEKILWRIDNEMKNSNHSPAEGSKQYPFYTAWIAINELSQHKLLINYLKNIFSVLTETAKEAEAVIYERTKLYSEDQNLEELLDQLNEVKIGYPPLAVQVVANCAYANYSAGLCYRLWQLGDTEDSKVFDWLISEALQFGFRDHSTDNSDSQSMFEKMQKEKRKNEAKLIQNQKVFAATTFFSSTASAAAIPPQSQNSMPNSIVDGVETDGPISSGAEGYSKVTNATGTSLLSFGKKGSEVRNVKTKESINSIAGNFSWPQLPPGM